MNHATNRKRGRRSRRGREGANDGAPPDDRGSIVYLQRAAASPAGRSCEFLYRPAAAIPPGARRGLGGPSRPRPVRYNGRAALAGQARRPASPATCLLSNLLTNCRRGRRQLLLACTRRHFPPFLCDAAGAAGGRAGLRSRGSAGIRSNAEGRCANAR